ncbi:MAG: iron complex outermembrane receptor protein [Halieaceae bacterium]|jgi:iron complex outermembrane receptor protein
MPQVKSQDNTTRAFHAFLSALALGGASTQATAQANANALEEIIVTASKRSQSLQDVPMAITAFNEQLIRQAGIDNADDLAILTPSLTISTGNQPFTASFRIRGIGTSQDDIALEPSVGIFVDDVFLSRSGLSMSDLTDIERIEVLQGPQGTLYGKNTNAGAIGIFTQDPNLEEFEGYVDTSIGNYDLTKLTLTASSPVNESLAYRISATINKRDGYFDNGAGDDLNSASDWNVLAKLLYAPSDDLRILIKGSHVNRDAKCCAADSTQDVSVNKELAARGLATNKNNPFDHEVAVNVDNNFENTVDSLSVVIDYDQNWGSIKSITAWGQADGSASYDVDRSQLDVMSSVDATSDGVDFSQELRFSSPTEGSLDYQLGMFYFMGTTTGGDGSPFVFVGEDFISLANQQPAIAALLPVGVPNIAFIAQPGDSISADVELETQTFAIFGQSTWHISERWRMTGGLRWTNERKDADILTRIDSTAVSAQLAGLSFLNAVTTPVDSAFSRNTRDVNWLLNTSFDLLHDTMIYARVATGSKSGGFNTVNGTPEQRAFEDETTGSYELGVKSTLLDGRLRINAAAFYTEIDDYQYQQAQELGLGTFVSSLPAVETSGLDLNLQAQALPNLTLTSGLLYMHKYEITEGSQKGDDLPLTAQYNANVSATWVFPLADGGIYVRADYSYMSDHLTNEAANPRNKDYQDRSLVNTKLGWRNDHWDISFWGKNLSNNQYAARTAVTFPITTMDAYFLAPPRTYGASLRYDF